MTITLQLSAEQQRLLEDGAARQDAAIVRRVLLQAVDATVPLLLEKPSSNPIPTDFDALLDAIVADLPEAPNLPDDAVTRAGIYGDHP